MEYIDAVQEEKKEMQKAVKKLVAKKKIRNTVIVLILVTVILAFAVFSAYKSGRDTISAEKEALIAELNVKIEELEAEIKRLIENPVVIEPVAPKIELEVINSGIKEIGELATIEYLFTDAARFSDTKHFYELFGEDAKINKLTDWSLPGTEKKFTVKWDGTIKAGIKVDLISVILKESEKKFAITLPHAEILSYEVDYDSYEWSEDNNIFNPISIGDRLTVDKETKAHMIERVIENGLLEKAEESAEKIITNLIMSTPGVDDSYTITFAYE